MAPGVNDVDLYELLGILPNATLSEIKKAYRKKALTCHPDKNPDNPRAAKEWEELSKALEILADSEARAAYDKVLKAKKANELRNRALESKRRKVKEDLEAREAAFRDGQERERGKDAAQQLQAVIKRLQEEGSRILEEEQRLLKEELKKGNSPSQEGGDPPRLKIKWRSKKTDDTNGGYSYDILYKSLQKYGAISNLLISSKKRGSAIVEFLSSKAAELAIRNEMGLSSNPLELSWLSGQPKTTPESTWLPPQISSDGSELDFESQVLQKLKRSAEQQKRSSPMRQEESSSDRSSSHQDGSEIPGLGNRVDAEAQLRADLPSSLGKDGAGLPSDNGDGRIGEDSGLMSTDHSAAAPPTGVGAKDYESLVLMRMRQTAERQRLIEQMAREDAEET